MKKYLVETPGDYALHDLVGQQTVQAFRPCVVTGTPFIESHRAGKLTILEELDEAAEDTTLALASTEAALEAAIKALPRAKAKKDPLDHDGDGRRGGSKPRSAQAE